MQSRQDKPKSSEILNCQHCSLVFGLPNFRPRVCLTETFRGSRHGDKRRPSFGARGNYDMQEYRHSGSSRTALFDDRDGDWVKIWISKEMNNIYWASMGSKQTNLIYNSSKNNRAYSMYHTLTL
jgi:hypothetical protein